jgi:hypothetical protein
MPTADEHIPQLKSNDVKAREVGETSDDGGKLSWTGDENQGFYTRTERTLFTIIYNTGAHSWEMRPIPLRGKGDPAAILAERKTLKQLIHNNVRYPTKTGPRRVPIKKAATLAEAKALAQATYNKELKRTAAPEAGDGDDAATSRDYILARLDRDGLTEQARKVPAKLTDIEWENLWREENKRRQAASMTAPQQRSKG